MKKMRVLDLFSGIGGFSLGLERAGGFETVAFCEIEPFCQDVLAKHWPGVPIYDDVRTVKYEPGMADVITGGFPCQDISYAGNRAGIAGERSGLYREMVRAIRLVRPRYAIMENVAALLNNGMGTVCGELATHGYDAEWDCVSASDIGAPHGRDRVWITFADTNQFKRAHRSHQGHGWWLRCAQETEKAGNADSVWKLEPPRLLGNIRRWIDNTASDRAWWSCDWQEKFEAFRRMDDGIPTRLDRADVANSIKSLGNTVQRQIPELIGKAIMEAAQ